MYFKIDGTSWVVISAGRACSAYLGPDAPLGGIHHWGKAGSGHVRCQGICPPTMLTTMMIFIIVWDKQEVWLWTCSGICSPTCFEFWLKWEETRIQIFWIPVLCGYFGGWHSSTRFPHSQSNLLRYTRTTQRKFYQWGIFFEGWSWKKRRLRWRKQIFSSLYSGEFCPFAFSAKTMLIEIFLAKIQLERAWVGGVKINCYLLQSHLSVLVDLSRLHRPEKMMPWNLC